MLNAPASIRPTTRAFSNIDVAADVRRCETRTLAFMGGLVQQSHQHAIELMRDSVRREAAVQQILVSMLHMSLGPQIGMGRPDVTPPIAGAQQMIDLLTQAPPKLRALNEHFEQAMNLQQDVYTH